jgi:TRAP-type C4-dicarboxylate transport system permease small subunit
VEIPAALLVVADRHPVCGVVSRYGFRSPLIWSDELASILFLWLAMFGAVVAFRRAEHMRMTAVVAKCEPGLRAFLDMVGTWAALAFLLMIVWPSYEYAYEESFITTPALQIPEFMACSGITDWRRPNGIVRVAAPDAASGKKQLLMSLVAVAGIIAGILVLAAGSTAARQSQSDHLLCRRGGAVRFRRRADCVCLRVVDLRLSCSDHHTPPMVLVGRMDEGMSHLILLAVPLFVFLGLLIEMTGMARAMVAFLASLLGHARRPALRADRRDVSGVGHFRLEGRRHGRRCAGAVS